MRCIVSAYPFTRPHLIRSDQIRSHVLRKRSTLTDIFRPLNDDSIITNGSGFPSVPRVHMMRFMMFRSVYPPLSGGALSRSSNRVVSRKSGSRAPDCSALSLNSPVPIARMIAATKASSTGCSVATFLLKSTKKFCQPDIIAGKVDGQSRGSGTA